MMAFMTNSWVASFAGISAAIRPAAMTYTRSEIPSTSGSSDEMMMTAFPSAARRLMIV